MLKFNSITLYCVAAIVCLSSLAQAEETQIDVRVISKGAKFMEITIKDHKTGQLLAQGKTAGSTGNTSKIMTEAAKHHAPVSTEDSAVFHAVIDLEEPRRVEISAHGPLAQPQAAGNISVTQWVVPGKHITGGALRLELPGFVVDILSPPAHIRLKTANTPINLKANVVMMCGCPIQPGGLWDADKFEVNAIIKRDGAKIDEVPLSYAGATSQFSASLNHKEPGTYEITVYAYDPANGNTGVDKTTYVLAE